jgi:Na+-transporting NADH:ubiquinone oxidoreductase subunit F
VALLKPLPEDHWDSYTGSIHEVLTLEYLDTHPDPRAIEYFLCDPPVMVPAATRMLAVFGIDPAQIAFDEF